MSDKVAVFSVLSVTLSKVLDSSLLLFSEVDLKLIYFFNRIIPSELINLAFPFIFIKGFSSL